MLNQRGKRFVTILLIAALALFAPALSETLTVYVATDGAKVYDAAGQAVGSLPLDTPLTLTGVKGSICRVEKDGTAAYMLKSDLSQSPSGAAATPVPEASSQRSVAAYVNKEGAAVYDAGGQQAGTLSLNAQVSVTAVKGGVCEIKYNGNTGYMRKSDLSASPVSATPAPTAEATATPAPAQSSQGVTAYVRTDGAKVYDAGGSVIAALGLNAQVSVTAVKGSVCQVTAGDRAGYMRKGDLSSEKVQAQPTVQCATAYVGRDGAKVLDAGGSVIATLSLNDSVSVTAVKGGVSQVTAGGRVGYMSSEDLSCDKLAAATPTPTPKPASAPTGGSTVTPATGTAKEMDWWTSDIQTIFARGVVAQITDVETGLSWREKRFGGTNHADCQPLTAADTAALKKAYGGKWSWNRRAVFVTIDGVNYAASINGMPHGGGSINDNDFNGHHCIHFTNSRTHGSNKICPLHQAAIKKAASATLK